MSTFPEYVDYDAIGLAELVRARKVSPKLLVEAAIERIEAVNPKLNAVVTKLYDMALRRAEQSFSDESAFPGVPFLVKDFLSPLAGVPFTAGSRFYANYIPTKDAELMVRYKNAGLNILGKTSTPEFAMMPVTEPVLFGACRNPWDLGRTPGGSSGGAAAMVAAGAVPIAHGGDGGGSIRIPASCCGVFGLKPTRGRNPAGPDASEHWMGFASEHVLSRTVRDSAAALDASQGPEITSPYWAPPPERPFLMEVGAKVGRLRIAFTDKPHLPGHVHGDCRAAMLDAAKLCESLGHHVEEASPVMDGEAFAHAFFTVVCASVAAGIEEAERDVGRKPRSDELEIPTWLAGLLGQGLSAGSVITALSVLQSCARDVHRFFDRYDVLLTPTLGAPPLKIGELEATGAERLAHRTIANLRLGSVLRLRRVVKAVVDRIFEFVPFPPVANVTGQPSMSVPLYWNRAGLPIGTMFTGRFGQDALLFRLAAQLEEARPWAKHLPKIHCA